MQAGNFKTKLCWTIKFQNYKAPWQLCINIVSYSNGVKSKLANTENDQGKW